MTLQDLQLLEESLFSNYNSKGYSDVVSSLQIALDKVIAKIANIDGDTYTRQQLIMYKKMLTDAITESYGGLFAAMQDESVKSAEIIGSYMAISTKVLPQRVIDDLINSNRNILGYGFSELFKTQSDNHARALRVVLGAGVADGMPAKQIVKELIDKNNKHTQVILEGNVFTTIKSARETVRGHRYTEYEKMGIIKGYVYDSVLDGRTSDACIQRSNRKYFVSFDEIPSSDKPPIHFRCRSVLVPISTNDYTSGKKASMFGEVKNTSYPEWVKGLDDDKQRIVLGKRYNAYKKGTYKINSLKDIKGVADYSLDEISTILNDKSNFN